MIKIEYAKQSIIYTSGHIITLASDWIIMMLLPLFCSYAKQGVYSFAFAITSVLSTIGLFSLRNYQVIMGKSTIQQRCIYSVQIYLVLLCSILLMGMCLITKWSEETVFVMCVLFLWQMTPVFVSPMFGELQMIERLDIAGFAAILSGVLKLVLFVSASKISNSFFISLFVSYFITTLCYFIYVFTSYKKIKNHNPPINMVINNDMFRILKDCFPLMVASVLPTIINSVPKIIIKRECGEVYLGYYTTLTAFSVFLPTVITGLTAPLLNTYSKLFRAGDIDILSDKWKKLLKRVVLYFVLGSLVITPLFCFGLYKIYGEIVIEHACVLCMSIIAMLFLALNNLALPIIIMFKKNNYELGITFLTLVLCIALCEVLTRRCSIEGATIAMLISYFICAQINTFFANSLMKT